MGAPAATSSVSGAPIMASANGEFSISGGDGNLKITIQYIEYTL